MSSGTKAFGRSIPRDMQEARRELLQSTGQASLLEKPTQLWKINNVRAGKNGNCQAVYWVQERANASNLKPLTKPEKQWTTGSIYKGEWQGNLKHGYGIQLWSNGNKYEGEWAGGNREGHGVFWLKEKQGNGIGAGAKTKNEEEKTETAAAKASSSSSALASPEKSNKKLRRVYAGNWKNDMKDGVGVYFYPDGSRYEGCWSCDVRCGRGTLYLLNGDSYTGEWKSGLQNGFGTLTRVNADVYEGEWLNGLREGSGIYYYKSQEKIYDGEWVNDQPKCGVYCDAKEFFNDDEEEARYAVANGGAGNSSESAAASLASNISPRMPRSLRARKIPIPRLRMADADGILAAAIEAIGVARAPQRNLPHVSLGELFDSASLDALRRLFARFDTDLTTGNGSGQVSLQHLPAMFSELALPVLTRPQMKLLITDLRKKDAKEKMSFQEFVRAVHLVEEAKNAQQAQEAQQTQEEEE